MLFFRIKIIFFFTSNIIKTKYKNKMAKIKCVVRYKVGNKTYTKKSTAHRAAVHKRCSHNSFLSFK